MQLLEKGKVHQINAAQVLQAVILLCGSGVLKIAQDDVEVQSARNKTEILNTFLMQKARSNAEIGYLASPVTGGGIAMPRFDQLFSLTNSVGNRNPLRRVIWHNLLGKYCLHRGSD